jgi:hypothetical protein
LKIDLPRLIHRGWSLLTEVPDWPGAPVSARIGRALPIALPVAAMLALAAWTIAVSDRAYNGARAGRQPLLELESEVAALGQTCTNRGAYDLRERASETARSLMGGQKDLDKVLEGAKRTAAIQGWDAAFQAGNGRVDSESKGSSVAFLTAKGTLHPAPGNKHPWETLLLLLDKVSAPGQPIDLTRLAIRADEEGRCSVDVVLRVAYIVANEKIAK